MAELILTFTAPGPIAEVSLITPGARRPETSQGMPFTSPVTESDRKEIRWYLETYAASYTSEADDQQAARIAEKLPRIGLALFEAVFQDFTAQQFFTRFLADTQPGRSLTIETNEPEVLMLPWELLRSPGRDYLFLENPRVTVRRQVNAGIAGGGRPPLRLETKEKLRLLFVVSRPEGAGFLDPRAEPQAVMDAIAKVGAPVEVEFLRPATLQNLADRLECTKRYRRLPPVDIVHFDGHGVFDEAGTLHERAKLTDPVAQTKDATKATNPNTGYLLFEDERGQQALITAETLGGMLNQQRVGLVVLSACQSAAIGIEESQKSTSEGEDQNSTPQEQKATGSVAVRLLAAGIPAVVAMTHSVLVATTLKLFAEFYERLAYGEGIGEALDNARRKLYAEKGRGQRQRSEGSITLKLEDWFLPALYQTSDDIPLLREEPQPPFQTQTQAQTQPQPIGNLPELPEVGFFGRAWELWRIERAFTVEQTQRLTLSGFGGQGKTLLATEAATWLCRTGCFETACFVDFASFQGVDALGLTLSTLGTVLNQSFVDAAAARQALTQRAVVLVLDNLEDVAAEPLRELLTAAKDWSEAGPSRLLLTTRQDALGVPGYEPSGTFKHQQIPLKGLQPPDAIALFERVLALPGSVEVPPPAPKALQRVFGMVDYHPLSIRLLAQELKHHRIADVGIALARLLQETQETDKNRSLIASLRFSLERLEPELRQWVCQLGVFEGGCGEPMVTMVTNLETDQWQRVKLALQSVGLVQAEVMPGVEESFWRFHPTLGPVLWQEAPETERESLHQRHRQAYYQLADYLYQADSQTPIQTRQIARRELPNLLKAAYSALAAGEAFAVDFANRVNRFLDIFGLGKERAALTARTQTAAGDVGSRQWYLARSTLGEQLEAAGRAGEALQVFQEVQKNLGDGPTYEHCTTLNRIGRCLRTLGQAAQAAAGYRQALAVASQLEQTEGVKKQTGLLQTDLGSVLTDMGQFEEARTAYEASLAIKRELGGDDRGEATVEFQLGTLELKQGNLAEAERRYKQALQTFQYLQEPATEANVWHQLGCVYQEAKQWDAAETAYREAAKIDEAQGNLAEAAQTWNQLAMVNEYAGKPEAAEAWYRKVIAADRVTGGGLYLARHLSNLANLLQQQGSDRLQEARQLAEEALAIDKTLDPAAAQIWKTYDILADVADQQNDPTQAQVYRRQARQAKAAYAGTQYELQQLQPLIEGVVAATQNAEVRQQIEAVFPQLVQMNAPNLPDAIRMIWNGDRDEETVCERLGGGEAMIAMAILQQLG
ncbi:MAG: tetratricopeptide repeat protein [Prochlorotrichaceae cyanobacterium]